MNTGGCTGPRYTYLFRGDPPTPDATGVKGLKLKAAIVSLYETVQKNWTGVNRDERYAPPHRQAILDAIDGLANTHRAAASRESDALNKAVRALRDFRRDHLRKSAVGGGDRPFHLRLFFGYDATRPGYRQLMDDVFVAAGLGKVSTFIDVSPN